MEENKNKEVTENKENLENVKNEDSSKNENQEIIENKEVENLAKENAVISNDNSENDGKNQEAEKVSDSSENQEVEKENKSNKTKKKSSGFGTKLAIFVVIILIICVIIELFTEFFSKSFSKIRYDYLKSKGAVGGVGNTIGNIRNHGYIVTDDEYLYFMSPNKMASAIGIKRIKKDDLTGKAETLLQGTWEITGLNYLDGYLYFVTFADPEAVINDDNVDNKIHKMRVDGSEHTIINDNEFNNKNYEIYAVNDKIYYIGEDENIYYMDLDGNNKTKLNDNKCGFIGVTEDYIFYNKIIDNENESFGVNFETHRMNLDGSDDRAIFEDGKIFNMNVVNDYIYYVDESRHLFRIKIDGTEREMLSDDTAFCLNVAEDGIYYINYYKIEGDTAGMAIYRKDLDGKNPSQLAKIDTYSENLGEFGNWLFFTDNNEDEGRFTLVSKDGSQTITLYKLDFSKFITIGEDTADIVLNSNNANTDEDGEQESELQENN